MLFLVSLLLIATQSVVAATGTVGPPPSVPSSARHVSATPGQSTNIALYALAISVASLAASATTAFVQFRTHRAKKPVVAITISDLPPYTDNSGTTYVHIKNVGTAATSRHVNIAVSCTWMPLISYKLNLPTEDYCLEPSEEYWWRFRMNDRVVPNSMVTVIVSDAGADDFWKLHQHIEAISTP